MRAPADGQERAGLVRKSVGGTERFSESPAPLQALSPQPSRPRLSLAGDAADRAARTLAERVPPPPPRAKAQDAPPPSAEATPPQPTPQPAKLSPEAAAERQQREQRAAAKARCAALTGLERRLRADAPAAFCDPPPPLKIGIDRDIAELLAGEVSKKTLGRFLVRWTGRAGYLRAVAGGGARYDLDGQAAGEVTADQRETAVAALAARDAEGAP